MGGRSTVKKAPTAVSNGIVHHFSAIAPRYSGLRTTDLEVITRLIEKLPARRPLRIVDVGCGSGRYDIGLLSRLGERLSLVCLDSNFEMLRTLHQELGRQCLDGYHVLRGSARGLPFRGQHLDSVLTFNAIHHFNVPTFLRECARVLRPDGAVLIYTRTRSQNRRNIWGRHFPSFAKKETRLFEIEELEELVARTPGLELDEIQGFRFDRLASLDWLLEQARNHHYSTFALYEPSELDWAMRQFRENVRRNYLDPAHVTWQDTNTLLVARRAS
jgi:ubiquinone/menaquinone biosynthesis C-methylase UbiE